MLLLLLLPLPLLMMMMLCVVNRTSWKLKQVSKNKDNTFALLYDTSDGQKRIRTRSVALTVPAYVAADLLQQDCSAAAEKLRGFDYPPVGAVTLAYPMSSIRDDRKDKEGQVPGKDLLLCNSYAVMHSPYCASGCCVGLACTCGQTTSR